MLDSEAQTRAQRIDSDLARAGWSSSRRNVVEEYLLQTDWTETDHAGRGFADYVLLGDDGKPLAVVEAKRSSRDEVAGKRQAAEYADAIFAEYGMEPFIFLSNGLHIQFWDRPSEMVTLSDTG